MQTTYAITYRSDPLITGKFNALYAMPDDAGWRIAVDRWGDIRKFGSAHEAEAAAGHHLCRALNRLRDEAEEG